MLVYACSIRDINFIISISQIFLTIPCMLRLHMYPELFLFTFCIYLFSACVKLLGSCMLSNRIYIERLCVQLYIYV